MPATTSAAWLDQAWAAFGVAETRGAASNTDILAFLRDAGHPEVRSDDVAWCAAFVGACLERAHRRCTRSLMARSYLSFGEPLSEPRTGAIAVLSRGSDPALGHVGFVVGVAPGRIHLLGGNQSDSVSVQSFPLERVLAFRWPSEVASPAEAPASRTTWDEPALFEFALVHVLEMEGGYTDDPHDPGGPTNLGITLATLADWRKVPLTAETFGGLKADLRSLDRATASAIYLARYWGPSRAADLRPALAFMHFDASVNHGVTGAARILQQACGADIDGEIGPLTLDAANSAPLSELIDRYGAIREDRYRALPHFWRFGRGWLNRVARTRAAALALIPASSQPKANPPMSTETDQPKWWGNSVSVWGTLLTALSTVLPVLGPLLGITLSAEAVQQIGAGVLQSIQAIGGLLGTVMAIYGRARAAQPLVRKPISLKL